MVIHHCTPAALTYPLTSPCSIAEIMGQPEERSGVKQWGVGSHRSFLFCTILPSSLPFTLIPSQKANYLISAKMPKSI